MRSLREYQQRLISIRDNLDLARRLTAEAQARYGAGGISLLDLLQTLERERRTAENFLEAYLGYQGTLLALQQVTYFDFESDRPLVERFIICAPSGDAIRTSAGAAAFPWVLLTLGSIGRSRGGVAVGSPAGSHTRNVVP